jgi:hypothetical protein
MKYKYVIRTYNKSGHNMYAEGAYTRSEADQKFEDMCKTVSDTVDIYRRHGKPHYTKVVLITFGTECVISEKIYEC